MFKFYNCCVICHDTGYKKEGGSIMSIRKKYRKKIQVMISCLLLLLAVFGVKTAREAKAAVDEVVEMTFGENYRGTAGSNGGTHFNFCLPSSGQIQLPIEHESEYMNVYLYDYAGSNIYEDQFGPNEKDILKLDLLAGNYTLCLEGLFYDVDYSFTPTFQPSNETISEEAEQQNNEEDFATSLENINTNIIGQFAVNDSKDVYTLTLEKSQKITLNIFSSVPKMRFSIKDSYEEYSYTSDIFSNGTHKFTLAVPEGTYYLTFANQNSEGTGMYRFTGSMGEFPETFIKSIKNSARKTMKVTWKRNDKVSGYQIQIATNSSFTKDKKTVTVANNKSQTKSITNLKKKTYYVRVRTYMETKKTSKSKAVNKKCYSGWSSLRKITIKK